MGSGVRGVTLGYLSRVGAAHALASGPATGGRGGLTAIERFVRAEQEEGDQRINMLGNRN